MASGMRVNDSSTRLGGAPLAAANTSPSPTTVTASPARAHAIRLAVCVVMVDMLSPSTPAGKRRVGRAAWLGHAPAPPAPSGQRIRYSVIGTWLVVVAVIFTWPWAVW